MPVKPSDAKKLAEEFNTRELSTLLEVSDELMRVVMEAGDMDKAIDAAQSAAEMAAALVVRKQGGVRELAKRVRDRVTEEGPAKMESAEPVADPKTEPANPDGADSES